MHKAFALVCLCHLTFYNDLFGFQDLAHFFILLCLWSNRLKLLMACSITRVLITMSPAVFGMRRILCRYMYCTCCVNLMQGGMLIRYTMHVLNSHPLTSTYPFLCGIHTRLCVVTETEAGGHMLG